MKYDSGVYIGHRKKDGKLSMFEIDYYGNVDELFASSELNIDDFIEVIGFVEKSKTENDEKLDYIIYPSSKKHNHVDPEKAIYRVGQYDELVTKCIFDLVNLFEQRGLFDSLCNKNDIRKKMSFTNI